MKTCPTKECGSELVKPNGRKDYRCANGHYHADKEFQLQSKAKSKDLAEAQTVEVKTGVVAPDGTEEVVTELASPEPTVSEGIADAEVASDDLSSETQEALDEASEPSTKE